SGGISYWGSPSLGGDAPARLVMTYLGMPRFNVGQPQPSMSLVSLLPDNQYQPMVNSFLQVDGTLGSASVPGRFTYSFRNPGSTSRGIVSFAPIPNVASGVPNPLWAGQHRILALARASGTGVQIFTMPNTLVSNPVSASVAVSMPAWGLYDLGTF